MSVRISKYKSNIYALKVKQNINRPIEDIWSFFATPKNLNELTPKEMKFEILSGKSDRFFEGKIISYTVNPFRFFNIKWVTEITHITFTNGVPQSSSTSTAGSVVTKDNVRTSSVRAEFDTIVENSKPIVSSN